MQKMPRFSTTSLQCSGGSIHQGAPRQMTWLPWRPGAATAAVRSSILDRWRHIHLYSRWSAKNKLTRNEIERIMFELEHRWLAYISSPNLLYVAHPNWTLCTKLSPSWKTGLENWSNPKLEHVLFSEEYVTYATCSDVFYFACTQHM